MMKPRLTKHWRVAPLLAACLWLLAGGFRAAAADLPDAYRIVVSRNVFDPNRTAPSEFRPPPPPPAATPSADTLTLAGVVAMRGQTTALFAGSNPALAGSRRQGESLDNLRLEALTTGAVTLTAPDGQTLILYVGGSLTRAPGQPWTPTAEKVTASAPIAPPSAAQTGAPASDAAADILKRLLERRQQELKK